MWVTIMCNRRDKLDSDRIARLESIGFIWNPLDQQWEEVFAKLKEYALSTTWGLPCPATLQRGFTLGRWIRTLRHQRAKLDSTRRKGSSYLELMLGRLNVVVQLQKSS
mmetsp:Transcript_8864/g.16048  ORF Transcript_8864/g.16048 Transcript_8864/m.16048 type:complete len:108 (-) Transcript_8864:88-411(-)